MQKQFFKSIVSLLLLVLPLFQGGCDREESGQLSQGGAIPVRILTSVDIGYASIPSGGGAMTRSGIVDESTAGYEEGIQDGNQQENAIGSLRVMAFSTDGEIKENVLYRKPGMVLGEGEKSFQYADAAGIVITRIQMDLKIEPGNYTFVLVANENAAWGLSSINTIGEMDAAEEIHSIPNEIRTPTDLATAVAYHVGIPMVGCQVVTIPFDATATELNPALVNPTIELKRTISKVEVNISNLDESGSVFEYAENFVIKSVSLINGNQRYNLMENAAENATGLYPSLNNPITHNAGEAFKKNILTHYLAERKDVEDETTATKVRIATESEGEDFIYDIPLYQKSEGNLDYDIRRNTIYRLNTLLKGRLLAYELNVYNIVEGWRDLYGEIQVDVPQQYFANIDAKYFTVKSSLSLELYFKGSRTFIIHTNLEMNPDDYYEVNNDGFDFELTPNPSGYPSGTYQLDVSFEGWFTEAQDRMPIILHFSKNGKKALSITIEAIKG